MSQVSSIKSSGGGGGTIVSLTTDDNVVVTPTDGTIEVKGFTNGDNIQTISTIGSNTPGTVVINPLFNDAGSVQTVGAVTENLYTFEVALLGSVTLNCTVTGVATSGAAIGGTAVVVAQNLGADATITNGQNINALTDPTLDTADFVFVTDGNNIILQVSGQDGQTINWFTYVIVITQDEPT
jgi:hypothetical protein